MYHCVVKECFTCYDTVVTSKFLPMDMNLYIEIVALYWVYTDPIATATILLRSWCQKGGKMSENIGDWVNKYLCGSVSMYHTCLSNFLKNKVYVD